MWVPGVSAKNLQFFTGAKRGGGVVVVFTRGHDWDLSSAGW